MSKGFNFAKIALQVMTRQEYVSPVKVRMFIPGGYPYGAFNSCAYVKPWSILQMVESHRAVAFGGVPGPEGVAPFLDIHRLYKDYLIFMVTAKTEVMPDMYDHFLQKGPLVSDMEVVNLGEKSVCLRTTISLEGAETPLSVTHAQSVIVSMKTRKTAAPPSWWYEKFSQRIECKEEELRLPRLDLAGETSLDNDCSVCVALSDVDPYLHLNWAKCIKFCYDAFILHRIKDENMKNKENINRNVKTVSASYLKEAPLGDRLRVGIWKNRKNEDLFHFQVTRGSQIINEVSMEFYPEDFDF